MDTEQLNFARPESNPRLASAPPWHPIPGWERVEMTVSCRDTDSIPKVSGAGGVFTSPDGLVYQRMHNGIRVLAGAYHGEWMSEVIRRLKGHHEPQEELLFHFVLPSCSPIGRVPTMLEVGSFWGYYSLWFRSVYPNARNILVEPDPNSLEVGRRNFELNGWNAEFVNAAVGLHNSTVDFVSESDGVKRPIRSVSVDGLFRELAIDQIDVLHADIQGAELTLLNGALETISSGRVNWVFLSTHHHSISGDPLTHQRCLDWLNAHGAHIIEEHSVAESFSGDGLIVAKFGARPTTSLPAISRNVASRSLFCEPEYDLAEAWNEIRRLRSEVRRLSGGS